MNTIARLLNVLFLLTILNPAKGAMFNGVVRLTATTHYCPTPGVTALTFLVDGKLACKAHKPAGYNHRWTCSWDSRSVGDGDHTLTAEAFCPSGAIVERTDMKMAEK